MPWTSTYTWTAGETVTATKMNEQLRDNMAYVHDGTPVSINLHNDGADYTTTSATFADVDATDLAKSITTTTGRVLICVTATISTSVSAEVSLDIDCDGSKIGTANTNGLCTHNCNTRSTMSFTVMKTGLSNGSHTFKLQWKTSAGTATMRSTTSTNPVVFQIMEW